MVNECGIISPKMQLTFELIRNSSRWREVFEQNRTRWQSVDEENHDELSIDTKYNSYTR